jgi:transposase InsO family protein
VSALCRRHGVTRAGFYAWCRRGVSTHAEQDRQLAVAIDRLFARHRERYGSPRIQEELARAGWRVSRRRVARLMRAAGLRAKAVRGYRAKASIHHQYARHPNRLWRRRVTRPNQVWVGDITYFKVATAWNRLLTRLGVQQSATVRGPSDHPHAESFFHSLKAELTRGLVFPSECALRSQLASYIRYYNTTRLHSGLGYQSPLAFERRAA